MDCLSLYFVASIASAHINSTAELNQNNLGLGLGCQLRPTIALEAGFFRDSFDGTTIYAIAVRDWTLGPIKAGAFAGMARYPDASINIALPSYNDIIPVAGLQATYGPILLRLLPQDGIVADAVVALQFKTEF